MRILAGHNFYQQQGGEDLSHRANVEMLRENGHSVRVFELHNDAIKNMNRLGVVGKTFWSRGTSRQLGKILDEFKPDVAHFTNIFPLISPAAYAACRARRVAVVQGLHNYRLICPGVYLLRDGGVCEKCIGSRFALAGVRHRCYRNSVTGSAVVAGMSAYHRLIGTWQNAVDMFLTPAEFSRQKFIQAGFCSPERIAVKANFIDPDPLPGAASGKFAIYVGRLSAEKGINTLLDAWQQYTGSLTLKVVGDGDLRNQVRTAAEQDSRIEALGWIPHDQVLALMGEAQCLIMPSVWYETFGRNMVEAFSKQCPVIASRMGCMEEMVRDRVNGLLFTPGDAFGLAATITRMELDKQLRRRLRVGARATYLKHFTKDRNYPVLMDIYLRAIENCHLRHTSHPPGPYRQGSVPQ